MKISDVENGLLKYWQHCYKVPAISAFPGKLRNFSWQHISSAVSFSWNFSIHYEDLFLGTHFSVYLFFSLTAVCQTKVDPGTLSHLKHIIYLSFTILHKSSFYRFQEPAKATETAAERYSYR